MAKRAFHPRAPGFTLVEILVSIAVLALLVALIGQLFNNTTSASVISTNHIESDARVRLLFARMSADFSRIVKRPDIDYYLKSPAYIYWPAPLFPSTGTTTSANLETGNDQMAFFSGVSGYSSVADSPTDFQNTISLIAYRINTTGSTPCLERMGKALSWGGGSTAILPVVFEPTTIASMWQSATTIPTSTSSTDTANDEDYETIVPNAFRFEYYYLLNTGTLSATPWNSTSIPATLNGLRDVAGIGVVIAVTDRKASAIASSASLTTLAGQMSDFPSSGTPIFGSLQASWQNTVTGSGLSPAVINGIRIYEQLFSINTPSQ